MLICRSSHSRKGRLLAELIDEVVTLQQSVLTASDKIGGKLGLTRSLWQVLCATENAPLSVPQISRALNLTRQSVQRSVNILVRDGLLETIPNPDHKNSPLVEHSRKTQLAFRRVSRLQVVWADRLADGWSVNDLTTVIQMLRLLRTSIDDDKQQSTSLK
ncbi:MAG: MarR family transcriptional regulator [Planctomycetaceae bacterium]|nr:MarR family transcriptional regulator [Planctomycetaceae bacterium]